MAYTDSSPDKLGWSAPTQVTVPPPPPPTGRSFTRKIRPAGTLQHYSGHFLSGFSNNVYVPFVHFSLVPVQNNSRLNNRKKQLKNKL